METLVETQGRSRTLAQYIKMLSVIALPVAAVICLVSYTLHNSRVERADPVTTNYVIEDNLEIRTKSSSSSNSNSDGEAGGREGGGSRGPGGDEDEKEKEAENEE